MKILDGVDTLPEVQRTSWQRLPFNMIQENSIPWPSEETVAGQTK